MVPIGEITEKGNVERTHDEIITILTGTNIKTVEGPIVTTGTLKMSLHGDVIGRVGQGDLNPDLMVVEVAASPPDTDANRWSEKGRRTTAMYQRVRGSIKRRQEELRRKLLKKTLIGNESHIAETRMQMMMLYPSHQPVGVDGAKYTVEVWLLRHLHSTFLLCR